MSDPEWKRLVLIYPTNPLGRVPVLIQEGRNLLGHIAQIGFGRHLIRLRMRRICPKVHAAITSLHVMQTCPCNLRVSAKIDIKNRTRRPGRRKGTNTSRGHRNKISHSINAALASGWVWQPTVLLIMKSVQQCLFLHRLSLAQISSV